MFMLLLLTVLALWAMFVVSALAGALTFERGTVIFVALDLVTSGVLLFILNTEEREAVL